MSIDYSLILKTSRLRSEDRMGDTILTESESDRGRVLYSPAFRRLQQRAHVFSIHAKTAARSELSQALQVAHVGRNIANQIATWLDTDDHVNPLTGRAIVNFVETACLMREIGNPPFGRAGAAAIQKWFADCGPGKIRAACKSYSGREIDIADPRLLNALADFVEFDGNPQGLRVIAKLQWNTDPRGLNLTKTSIATYLKYLRMAGAEATESGEERFSEKVGFFSTEAGLVKNVWSDFSYTPASPQRFPLTYIVQAADDIVSCLGDLEDAIEAGLVRFDQVLEQIKDDWLSTYIPLDSDPCDDVIMECFTKASDAASGAGGEYSYADFRTELIAGLCEYAARQYIARHPSVFDGSLDSLLPVSSGGGSILATLKNYCKQHVYSLDVVQQNELRGYKIMYGLLDHFGALLDCSAQRFQAALDRKTAQDEFGKSIFIEKKLLSHIPAEYIKTYTHLVAQVGNARGRDEEFEEWNARAHLIVDFLAGMTDAFAATTLHTLSGQ